MRDRRVVLGGIAAVVAAAVYGGVFAADGGADAARTVNANAIWFEASDTLSRWQQLKAAGDAAALATYEEQALSEREAWKFTSVLSVKVLNLEPEKQQVHVVMTTPGRMLGTSWFIDTQWLEP